MTTTDALVDELSRLAIDAYAAACEPYVDAVMDRIYIIAATSGGAGLLVGIAAGYAVGRLRRPNPPSGGDDVTAGAGWGSPQGEASQASRLQP